MTEVQLKIERWEFSALKHIQVKTVQSPFIEIVHTRGRQIACANEGGSIAQLNMMLA